MRYKEIRGRWPWKNPKDCDNVAQNVPEEVQMEELGEKSKVQAREYVVGDKSIA